MNIVRQWIYDYSWTWPFWVIAGAWTCFLGVLAWLVYERVQLGNQLQQILQNW